MIIGWKSIIGTITIISFARLSDKNMLVADIACISIQNVPFSCLNASLSRWVKCIDINIWTHCMLQCALAEAVTKWPLRTSVRTDRKCKNFSASLDLHRHTLSRATQLSCYTQVCIKPQKDQVIGPLSDKHTDLNQMKLAIVGGYIPASHMSALCTWLYFNL